MKLYLEIEQNWTGEQNLIFVSVGVLTTSTKVSFLEKRLSHRLQL